MVGFLVCDGFTSTFQEKVFRDCKTTKYNQMMYVNTGSAVVSITSFLVSGAAPGTLAFCLKYPEFVTQAMTLSGAAVGGQYFIYSQVKEFGALVLAATMNLRQVISIMVSYLLYGHSITLLQSIGLVLVFASLFYKTYLGYKGGKKNPKTTKAVTIETAEDQEEDEKTPKTTTNGAEVVGKPTDA
jgi:adenosine 3'-phospho 5'-phosphosulfate transporter B2